MTIHQLINLGIKKLTTSPSPALDSEVLLSFVLEKPKEYLLTNPRKKVDPKKEKKFLTAINRRLLGWPVAYLTGQKEFYKLNFYVDKKVLIPRPETEGLIELVLKSLKIENRKLRILDIGTGSGNIIITLAIALRNAELDSASLADPELNSGLRSFEFFASDISPKAIQVAKKNAKKHKVKIKFADGNLLEPWGNQKFDVIVANLPYLAKLVDPTTKFEPKGALIAAKKGLKLYKELFKQISNLREVRPKYMFLEIGRDQGSAIKKLATKWLPAYKAKIYKDLFGRTRYARLAILS